MASTQTWSMLQEAGSSHPGRWPLLKTTRDFDQSLSHPGRNRGHRLRWWKGQGTPEGCRGSQTGPKCCCCRGTPLPPGPVASPGDGPRRWGACSPGGGSTAPQLLWGQFQDSWTQKYARHAYTGCSRPQNAHRPLGSQCPLLKRKYSWLTKGNKRLKMLQSPWLDETWLSRLSRTCGRSTVDCGINALTVMSVYFHTKLTGL